jgi:hypothetical protein
MSDPLWATCCVAGAGGLCGKPVRAPVVGMLGFCGEHEATGACCACGKFWIAADRDAQVGRYGYHSPAECRERRQP